MELQELKDIWQVYDKKLDKHVKLNIQMFKKINLDKTRSALGKFTRTPTLGLIIGVATQMAMGIFIFNQLSTPVYIIPAALIWVFALLQAIFSGYQLSVILHTSVGGEMNYDLPITEIQKKLQRLKIYRTRYLLVTRFAYGLLWLPFLIVCSRAFWNFDFFRYFDHLWILSTILVGLVITLFGIWLSMSYGKEKFSLAFLNKIIDEISVGDITGKGLVSAMTFLDEIEAFEKED